MGLDGKATQERRKISRKVVDILFLRKLSGFSRPEETGFHGGLVLQPHLSHQNFFRFCIGGAGDGASEREAARRMFF
jgi:hypothetical protein